MTGMSWFHRKIDLRSAILLVVLGGIILSSILVHLTWWRTARGVSDDLVYELSTEITKEVRGDWWERVVSVQSLTRTVGVLLDNAGDMPDSETPILAASRFAQVLVWIVLVQHDGTIIAADRPDPDSVRLFRAKEDGPSQFVTAITRNGETIEEGIDTGPPQLVIQGQKWVETARARTRPGWVDVDVTPDGTESGVAFVVPTDRGVLASILGFNRFAELMGSIAVGETGRSYVIGPEGDIVLRSVRDGEEPMANLDAVALAAGEHVAARPRDELNVQAKVRLKVDGAQYAVGLTPLWFRGWQLAIIIPEVEFLAEIDRTINFVVLGVLFFLICGGVIVAIMARRYIGDPVAKITKDMELIKDFKLEDIPHRSSNIREISQLSDTISGIATSLRDFGKFIPVELVRSLVADGKRAEPYAEDHELTILFADLAGFTSLTEKIGDQIVPILSNYFELASQAIEAEGGTVDKFIGDSVMAFWGAPTPVDNHALRACRAALAIDEGMREAAAKGEPLGDLKVRIGLHSGTAIVGNVGSKQRLNYTALGDTVNLAARLEPINKIYGTTVLTTAATLNRTDGAIQAREIDAVTVYGRQECVEIFEITGLSGDALQPKHRAYTKALSLYRNRNFEDALAELATTKVTDAPSRWLADLCTRLIKNPPPASWKPITQLDSK